MSNIRFEPQAKKLAKATGLDKLGQSTLQKLDPDKDGIVRLKDAKKLIKAAGLDSDGVLNAVDRKRIKEALGGAGNGASAGTNKASSSSVDAKAGGSAKTRKLNDGYMHLTAKKTAGGIQAELELTSYNKAGAVTGQSEGKVTIPNLDPVAIDVHHYDVKGLPTHATSTMPHSGPISETATSAAGAVLLVADKKRGLVLVDLLSSELVQGKAPAQRDFLSLDKLAKDSTVKAAAKALGLNPAKLSVEVLWASTSTGFEDKSLSTLAFELRLKDGSGKSKKQTFSTYLEGNMKKGLSALGIEKLERGVEKSWGWLYPPSAGAHAGKDEKPKTEPSDSSHHFTHASEGPLPSHVNTGDSEYSGSSHYNWTGGGE